MNLTTSLYDNRTIEYNLSNITNSVAQSDYLLSSTRFIWYNILRLCQVFIGIPANIMTLVVIKRLRFRLIMHILMVYMATTDILSSATLPMGIYIGASQAQVISFKNHWETFCILKVYFDMNIVLGSMLSYSMLSLDR